MTSPRPAPHTDSTHDISTSQHTGYHTNRVVPHTARVLQILWPADRKSIFYGFVHVSSTTLYLDETGSYGRKRRKDCRVARVGGSVEGFGKVDKEGLREHEIRTTQLKKRSIIFDRPIMAGCTDITTPAFCPQRHAGHYIRPPSTRHARHRNVT